MKRTNTGIEFDPELKAKIHNAKQYKATGHFSNFRSMKDLISYCILYCLENGIISLNQKEGEK